MKNALMYIYYNNMYTNIDYSTFIDMNLWESGISQKQG